MSGELELALEALAKSIPQYAVNSLREQAQRIKQLQIDIKAIEVRLAEVLRIDVDMKRVAAIPGVGLLSATAAIATMGEAKAFKSGREFCPCAPKELERQRRLAAKADAVSVHKGWRVSGIAPGLLNEAKQADSKPPEPFDEAAWLRTAKRTALRGKPYILHEAALQCKEMAIKTDWLDVQLQEVKKVVA